MYLAAKHRLFVAAALLWGANALGAPVSMVRLYSAKEKRYITVEKVVKTDEEWRKFRAPEPGPLVKP